MLDKCGILNKKCKPVVCITNGEEYISVTEAAEKTGCSLKHISAICLGKRKQTKGLTFKFKAA